MICSDEDVYGECDGVWRNKGELGGLNIRECVDLLGGQQWTEGKKDNVKVFQRGILMAV